MGERPRPERVLVRAPNWVGDVVMSTPALRALRAGCPDAEITVEAHPFLRELLEPLDSVDHFLPFTGRGLTNLVQRVRTLRESRFDWAVLFPDSQSSALGPFLARIPLRVGFARDALRRMLVNEPLAPPTDFGRGAPISMIERYLRITRHLGCDDVGDEMEVPISAAGQGAVERRLAEHDATDAPLLLAIPGASYGSSKLWPAEHFGRACAEIAREHDLVPVLAPGPGEEDVARAVVASFEAAGGGDSVCLTDPVLTLGELAALSVRARLAITNDTGPRQFAVALGVPAVVVMGPTDPRYTTHHLELQRVLREDVECSPCGQKTCPIELPSEFHRCMTRLEPARVVRAAEELLSPTHAK